MAILEMDIESAGVLASTYSSNGIWVISLPSTMTATGNLSLQLDILMVLNSTGALVSSQTMTREQSMALLATIQGSSSLEISGIYGIAISSDLTAMSIQVMNANDLPDLHEDGVVWVVNLDNNASSQYEQYGFNSFFTRDGVNYGVAEDGIYELDGNDDAGNPIDALAVLPKSDLGAPHLKNVPNFYIGLSSTGKMILKADADGKQYYYEARNSSEELENQRVDIGRGLEGKFWQFTLLNTDGCDFEIATIEFTPVVRRRRI